VRSRGEKQGIKSTKTYNKRQAIGREPVMRKDAGLRKAPSSDLKPVRFRQVHKQASIQTLKE
jgi:hypothetical protein